MLELIHFDRPGNPPARSRVINEPGLTHLSFSVRDVAATAARVPEFGGEVLPETDIGAAVFVRDPDGQPLELLSMEYPSRRPPKPWLSDAAERDETQRNVTISK